MALDDIQLEAEEHMSTAVEHFSKHLRGIRTGMASVALVEGLKVQYYGSSTDLRSVAQITTPESNMIAIKPFDPGSIKDIERAIVTSDLGITPSSDGKMIRLVLPPLSLERRKQLVQQVRQMSEQSKITIRNSRREANKKIDQEKKAGSLPEDDADRGKEEIQKLTKQYEDNIDKALEAKSKEIQQL